MNTPFRCSTGSAPSRIDARPSRLQALAQVLVLAAAPWLLAASALPDRLYGPVLLLYATAAGVQCWRGQRRAHRVLWLTAPGQPLLLDGQALQQVRLRAHGPWLQLRWQGGGRLLFWPDTLSRAA